MLFLLPFHLPRVMLEEVRINVNPLVPLLLLMMMMEGEGGGEKPHAGGSGGHGRHHERPRPPLGVHTQSSTPLPSLPGVGGWGQTDPSEVRS